MASVEVGCECPRCDLSASAVQTQDITNHPQTLLQVSRMPTWQFPKIVNPNFGKPPHGSSDAHQKLVSCHAQDVAVAASTWW